MALLTVIFTGFVLKKEDVWDELTNGGTKKVNDKLFGFVYFLIKWVTPVAIVVIFITNFIF
jgi:NSS family neurotransmitter:Na+ symporter